MKIIPANLKIVILLLGLMVSLLSSAAFAAASDRIYYRYINKDGVRVINHYIPPEYTQSGYEVVTARGDVLKSVAPVLTGEQLQRRTKERRIAKELAVWDAELRRRYSRASDIDSAKTRKLAGLNASLSILEGTHKNIRKQIGRQHREAAAFERQAKAVPEKIIKRIGVLEGTLATTEQQIKHRKREYQDISNQFDRDRERFLIIRPE